MEPIVFMVTVSSGIFCLAFLSQQGLEPATHPSEALAERYMNGSQRIFVTQTVHILQLDSAVTDSLPMESVVRPFQPYFPIN